MIAKLWQYRAFVLESVLREFRARYIGSALGGLWAVLNPLVQILVYTLVFAEVMRTRLPGSGDTFAYSIYLCAGVLPWTCFAEIVGRSTSMFLDNANLIKKSAFPRICLPATVLFSSLLHFGIVFTLFILFLALSGHLSWAGLLWSLPLTFIIAVMGVGVGLFFGTLNVFFRDIAQAQPIILQLWFWLTPIVWPLAAIPEGWRGWVNLNPMAPLVDALHGIFLGTHQPDLAALSGSLLFTFLALAVGYLLFRHKAAELADEL